LSTAPDRRRGEDAAIMIEGNRISAVGGASDLAQRFAGQKDIETLDATGKTVIPGLIDAHTHLNFFRPRTTQEIDAKWPAQFMGIVAMSNAQRMLAAGFTGMIGGGAQFTLDVWVKRAIRMGLFRGPRVVACSRG
jgi:imidazolonepropionase-like amidohydrolase